MGHRTPPKRSAEGPRTSRPPAAGSVATPIATAPPARSVAAPWAPWAIRLAALWLLAGAVAKALTGTPSELPAPLLDSGLDPFHVIATAVVVETAVAGVALMRPRLGWLPLVGTLITFAVILVLHLRSGADHCGCFGGAVPIPAWIMLAIDGSLAVIVAAAAFASRSDATYAADARSPTPSFALAAAIACALGLGWFADARLRPLHPIEERIVAGPPAPPLDGPERRDPPAATSTATPAPAAAGQHVPPTEPVRTPAPAAPAAPKPWALPDPLPSEVILRPILWLNKPLAETELGRFTDTSRFPPTATLVIYYESCSHCAKHLRELAEKQAADPSHSPTYVLVQLPTPKGDNIKTFVDVVPAGMHVTMPEAIARWVITVPWDVRIENGIVRGAENKRQTPKP